MKTTNQFFKTIFILVFMLISSVIYAKNIDSYSALHYYTKHYYCNLNGAVQSQQIRYSYIKPGFREHEYRTFMTIDDSKMFSSAYVEFYKNNQLKMKFGVVYDTVFYKGDKSIVQVMNTTPKI